MLNSSRAKDSAGIIGVGKSVLKKTNETIESLVPQIDTLKKYNKYDLFSAETEIKYEGYVINELRRIRVTQKLENLKLVFSLHGY